MESVRAKEWEDRAGGWFSSSSERKSLETRRDVQAAYFLTSFLPSPSLLISALFVQPACEVS